jgi:hypothetical protein
MICETTECTEEATHRYVWGGEHYVCAKHLQMTEMRAAKVGRPLPREPIYEIAELAEETPAEQPPLPDHVKAQMVGPDDLLPRPRSAGRRL